MRGGRIERCERLEKDEISLLLHSKKESFTMYVESLREVTKTNEFFDSRDFVLSQFLAGLALSGAPRDS